MQEEEICWSAILVIIIIGGIIIFSFDTCGGRSDDKYRTSYITYSTYSPTELPVLPSATPDPHHADPVSRRQSLLDRIESGAEMTKGQKRYTTARIEGDTLWLFAQYFKEYTNRDLVRQQLHDEFILCGFSEVRCARCDAGGQAYWIIYKR